MLLVSGLAIGAPGTRRNPPFASGMKAYEHDDFVAATDLGQDVQRSHFLRVSNMSLSPANGW